jgi:hypothetical protein
VTTADVQTYIETAMAEEYHYAAKPGTVRVIEDPQVRETYAARFEDPRHGTVDLLFITGGETGETRAILDRTLEEVEYASWPPHSGRLQFFV